MRAILAMLFLATSAVAQVPDFAPKPASAATLQANAKTRAALPTDDGRDLTFANQGFIATRTDPIIRDAKGVPLLNLDAYEFVKGTAPPTVNPSLWRHAGLLAKHGLFKVGEGIWQVRGFDISNMTLIAGKTGWIIVDPLTRREMAREALALANAKLGARAISAVIYTHSHSDHFGGVKGLFDGPVPADVPIVAPEHFTEEAASENVIAGPAMGRRATYQLGTSLSPGSQGQMSSGIGMGLSGGEITLSAPTDLVRKTGDTRMIDGVALEFQMVPESEAPAELNIMLPAQKTLLIGEIAVCTQHNILTPRGALVRNTLKWAGYLTEALRLYADRSDTLIASHCWPRFGKTEVRSFLTAQRDNYKFLHDQSVRAMNKGATIAELGEAVTPPDALAQIWSTRGYYGTYSHNAKAIYQRYLGWYDANPANLNPHVPTARASRYVAAIGGAAKVVALAKTAMADGDYRWASDLLNQLIFADPANAQAKALQADSFEQMAYQAEGALWRNMYLSAASELRSGVKPSSTGVSVDLITAIPTQMLFDSIATRLDPAKIGNARMTINFDITDRKEQVAVSVGNAVMINELGQSHPIPQATLTGPRQLLLGLFFLKAPLAALEANGLKIEGDRKSVEALQAAIEAPPPDFAIVTP